MKLGNRIIFFFTGSRKTIGEVVVATGTVIGGFWGFLLRIAGTLIAGVKTVKAKAIEKVKGKSLLEILKSIWEFLKKLFR